MADEKKIALVITLKADGASKAQEITVNLRGLGNAHSDAAKKSAEHGRAIEGLVKKILGLITIKEVVKVVKELGRAFVDSIQQALAFQSEFSPLRTEFEASASRIKTAFAGITSTALPAIIGFQTAIGDALAEFGRFVDQNRELIATNIAGWAADGARFIVGAFATAVSLASKSINGLRMAYHEVAAFVSFARGDMEATDAHEGAAAKALADMTKIDAGIAKLSEKANSYIDKAVKVSGELAKKSVSPVDPEMEARRTAEFDHQLAIRLSIVQRNANTEVAIQQALAVQHEIYEEKKRSTTRDRARQEQIQLLAVGQLISQLEARKVAEAAQAAEAEKKFSDSVAEYVIANRQRMAEAREKDQDREDARRDKAIAVEKDHLSRMESGFAKAQAQMTLLNQIEGERRLAETQGNLERARRLEDDAAQARKAAVDEYTDTIKGALGTAFGAIKTLVKAGVDQTKDLGQVALGVVGSIAESIVDKLIGELVGFLAEKLALSIVGAVAGTSAAIAASLAEINAYSAVAGAAAIASTAAIPIIGPALAPAAGEAAYALAQAYAARVALAEGGLVLGGSVGRDSVPAMLMPGEYVIPAPQVRANVAAGRAPDDSGKSGSGGGQGLTIQVNNSSFVPGTKADFQRAVNDAVLPAILALSRAGKLRLS